VRQLYQVLMLIHGAAENPTCRPPTTVIAVDDFRFQKRCPVGPPRFASCCGGGLLLKDSLWPRRAPSRLNMASPATGPSARSRALRRPTARGFARVGGQGFAAILACRPEFKHVVFRLAAYRQSLAWVS
jgi:hypothetical protein